MPKLLHHPTPKFYLHSKNKERTSIILSLTLPHKGAMLRFKYHSGLSIETRYWDFRKQRPKLVGRYHEYLSELQDRIKELEQQCIEILQAHRYAIHPTKLRQELDTKRGFGKRTTRNAKTAEPEMLSLLPFLDAYLEERKQSSTFKLGTWKVLQTWATHLKDYSAELKKPLDYADINNQFLPAFKNWLCDPKRNLSANYIAKGVSVLKQFMLEAKRRKYHQCEDFLDFRQQKERVVKVSLSFEEP